MTENTTNVRSRATSASTSSQARHLRYQGWSGLFVAPRVDPKAPELVFDPAPDEELPERELVVLLTHGHPEHIQGAIAHLARRDRAPITIVASAALCRYVMKHAPERGDRFVPVAPGEEVRVSGWTLRVFAWDHLPLLPRGPLKAARYVLKLMKRPSGLAKIVLGGVSGPPHEPMLGYSVREDAESSWLVHYGEGMHRETRPEELARVLGQGDVDALVFGVEPEDAEALPELLCGKRIENVRHLVAFEPHRPWRAGFGLSQLDGSSFVRALGGGDADARLLERGDDVTL